MTCWTIKLTTECPWIWLTLIGANRSKRKSSSNIMFLTRSALIEPLTAITAERGCFPANVQCRGRPNPVILLLDLAGECLRKLGYEVDVIGNLVPGDLTAYVLDDLVRRRRGPVPSTGPSTTKVFGRSPIFRYLKIPKVQISCSPGQEVLDCCRPVLKS